MLIADKLHAVIRILLAARLGGKPDLTVSQLAKEAGITLPMAKRHALRLESSGYLAIRSRIRLTDPYRLMKVWGYLYSLRELDHADFLSAERPQYVIQRIANWARRERMAYAFTLFSATELVSPYVAPSSTYLYVRRPDLQLWQAFFRGERIIPAEKEGNVVCLLVDDDYFKGSEEARGATIVSPAQLYADLMSFGGRGEEAAQEVFTMISLRMEDV